MRPLPEIRVGRFRVDPKRFPSATVKDLVQAALIAEAQFPDFTGGKPWRDPAITALTEAPA